MSHGIDLPIIRDPHTEATGDIKVCAKCRVEFTCGVEKDGHCWCFEVKLSAPVLMQLERQYGGCLCPKCIKEYAEAASVDVGMGVDTSAGSDNPSLPSVSDGSPSTQEV